MSTTLVPAEHAVASTTKSDDVDCREVKLTCSEGVVCSKDKPKEETVVVNMNELRHSSSTEPPLNKATVLQHCAKQQRDDEVQTPKQELPCGVVAPGVGASEYDAHVEAVMLDLLNNVVNNRDQLKYPKIETPVMKQDILSSQPHTIDPCVKPTPGEMAPEKKTRKRRSPARPRRSESSRLAEHCSPLGDVDHKWQLDVPVFRPTPEQWKLGMVKYIEDYIEPTGVAWDFGLCKIIPPNRFAWNSRLTTLEDEVINNTEQQIKPIRQHISGTKGCFRLDLVETKRLTPKEFREEANRQIGIPSETATMEEIDKQFWRSIGSTAAAPMYGSDNIGTLFEDAQLDGWNINDLDSILQYGFKNSKAVAGVTNPMLYFGMWRAMFAWHTEDMELNSVNYIHVGAPKVWYTVPPSQAARLEGFAKMQYGQESNICKDFLRHKNVMINPSKLHKVGISTVQAIQKCGEYMVTFPRGYHSGYNCGWNIAEAVNFATPRWVPFGRQAGWCTCEGYTVKFDVDSFVEKIRRSSPARLSTEPEVGDRVVVKWDTWPGEYLLRLKRKNADNSFSGVLERTDRTFGEWFFFPKKDKWRWPVAEDLVEPEAGDYVFIRWGDWDKPEYLVQVKIDTDGEVVVVVVDDEIDATAAAARQEEYRFDSRKDCWRWPEKNEIAHLTNGRKGESMFKKKQSKKRKRKRKKLKPADGAVVIVKWDGWDGEYLCRVKEHKNAAFTVVSADEKDKTFGEWAFDPDNDEWRWPEVRLNNSNKK